MVEVKFDTRQATNEIKRKIGAFGGLSRNYKLLADLTDTWFGEHDYVNEFVPARTGKLVSSGKRIGANKYTWRAVDKYGRSYAGIQFSGDNGSGVPSSRWKRADNYGHKGHKEWTAWAKKYRWKKFIDEYATPAVIKAAKEEMRKA